METNRKMVREIFSFIRENGKLTNRAQSSWGADNWELGNLVASLQDDGFTHLIASRESMLCVIDTVGRVLNFALGDENDLKELHEALFCNE
jgi:hypothetical protein